MDEEQCPICFRAFAIELLPSHVEACLSGGGGGGSRGGSRHASPAHTSGTYDADLELARRLQEEEEGGRGHGSGSHPASPAQPATSSTTSSAFDADLEFARRLQQEEEERNRPRGVKCELCSELTPVEELFILDECSHKYCKTCLRKYVVKQVCQSVTTTCPLKDCGAALSVRDMKELLPNTSNFTPSGSSQQATQRLLSELKQIMKTDPEKQGYSVKPIKDNLYHWEVRFFDFDKEEPLAADLKKTKEKAILLHVTFPQTYPFDPPFIRVIKPRFAFRTGHVTIGGSICTEMLTRSGWTPANTVESALVSIRANLLLGGARLDLSNKSDYSEREAKEAFERMRQQHGW